MTKRDGELALEYRTYKASSLNIITRDDGDLKNIEGHAAVFDKISGTWFLEQISPGAFAETIIQDDIRALFNHDRNYVLGRNTARTLTLAEDSEGLAVSIIPPDTQCARDLEVSIERGDITGMSIGFEILKESREVGEDGEPDLYTVEKVKLWDVSPVTFPFYEDTDVSLKSRSAWHAENQRRQGRPNIMGKRLQLLKREFEARRI